MINHFKTHLLNRPADFFLDSLFPTYVEESFQPFPPKAFTAPIDRLLFGENPDASLLDYRFFQFLRVIRGCHLTEHVTKFDARESYDELPNLLEEEGLFQTVIKPGYGLSITGNPQHDVLRRTFTVTRNLASGIPLAAYWQGDRRQPINLTPLSETSAILGQSGLTISTDRDGSWFVDYRCKPQRNISDIVSEVLELPDTVTRPLFQFVADVSPHYEDGYRTITDSLTKFCMILFAQAIANEKPSSFPEGSERRIAEEHTPLRPDAEGCFYYGTHTKDGLRISEIKQELQCIAPIRKRQVQLEIPVPEFSYIYLCWPIRFGLPVRNRIVFDGFLNSSWIVYDESDPEEQYIVFRSTYKIQHGLPVRIEIP